MKTRQASRYMYFSLAGAWLLSSHCTVPLFISETTRYMYLRECPPRRQAWKEIHRHHTVLSHHPLPRHRVCDLTGYRHSAEILCEYLYHRLQDQALAFLLAKSMPPNAVCQLGR